MQSIKEEANESPQLTKPKNKCNQLRRSLPNFALAVFHTGVSERNAAIIANAILEDFGLITPEDSSNVIDKSKVRREKQKVGRNLKKNPAASTLKSLYFDGRKDSVTIEIKNNGKFYKKVEKQEHVVLLQEPTSQYVTHISPERGTAECISEDIYNYFEENKVDLSEVSSIGCDGTVVNTGYISGIITLLEKRIGRPVHWFVCQLHGVELLLRHVFEHVDGRKIGPKGFCGPISKSLVDCEKLPVIKFEKIEAEIPEVDAKLLSSDQKYLKEISEAVVSGKCSEDLALKRPGPMSHSRWLTTASRTLRKYISTPKPNKKLKTLVEFIMKVYVPVWFTIKCNPFCYDGAKNLWKCISLSRQCTTDVQRIIDPVIQRNGYFGHPENILLAMVMDSEMSVREKAVEMILDCRNGTDEDDEGQLREFIIPTFNFSATDYTNLIDFDNCRVTEPPILSSIEADELKSLVFENQNKLKESLKLPCHTQAVERMVKIVTEASSRVHSFEARDSFIRARLAARKKLPKFSTKKDYLKKLN